MIKIKNLLILFILFSLPLALFAENKIYKVGFAQDTMGNDWRVAQVRELEEAFKNVPNIEFVYTNADGNSALQILHMEKLAKEVDILIASPRDAELMTPVISKIYNNGTPVILISRSINSEDYTTFIHPDNRAIANKSAEFIASKLKGKGKVFILQHTPTTTPAIQRTEGFLEVIKNYPDIKIVDTKVANSLRDEAILQTEDLIKSGIEFDAIYAQSDSMATGARMALKKHGLDPSRYIITGIDYIKEAKDAIKNGDQTASFTYPTGGKEGAEAAIKIINKEPLEKEIVIESVMVTKDNVDAIKPIF